MGLNIVFMGTPEFAARSLEALLGAECPHRVVAVVSQPDRRAGRGKRLISPPVATLAKAHGLPLLQPTSVKTRAFRLWVQEHGPDIAVVAAFGHLLGPKALAVPRLGSINVHASLLPRWRGASPIQSAIAAGDAETGVSIMQMDVGMDTGAVYRKVALAISGDHTGASLHDDLADAGVGVLLTTLNEIEAGTAVAQAQPEEGITHAGMIKKSDSDLDWRLPASVLERRIRAYCPWPGARGFIGNAVVKVAPPTVALAKGAAGISGEALVPGSIVSTDTAGVVVRCGEGTSLKLTRLQAPGRKMVPAADFMNGFTLTPGMAFECRVSDAV